MGGKVCTASLFGYAEHYAAYLHAHYYLQHYHHYGKKAKTL